MPTYKVIKKGFRNGRKYPGQTITTEQPLDPIPSWLEPISGKSEQTAGEPVLAEPAPAADQVNASANAIKLAKEFTVNLDDVEGTGTGGQITVTDVKNFINQNTNPAVAEEGGAGVNSEIVDSSSNVQVI